MFMSCILHYAPNLFTLNVTKSNFSSSYAIVKVPLSG
jgi:hypothetical protein